MGGSSSKPAPEEEEELSMFATEDVVREIREKGLSGLKAIFEKKRNEWKDVPLNVAIIGNSGTGKSTFINALRSVDADDEERGAEVGEIETTQVVKAYQHPNNKNLQFWDLPGVGTKTFPQRSYLRDVKFDRYDFFIILSKDRFTENDTWLAQQIDSVKKKFYFVRTKIDDAVVNDKRAHKKTHNEQRLLQKIRDYCTTNLMEAGLHLQPEIFLISSYDECKFDFGILAEKLISDSPKREVMIMALNIRTEAIIKMKVESVTFRFKLLIFCRYLYSGTSYMEFVQQLSCLKELGLDFRSLSVASVKLKTTADRLERELGLSPLYDESFFKVRVAVTLHYKVWQVIEKAALELNRRLLAAVF